MKKLCTILSILTLSLSMVGLAKANSISISDIRTKVVEFKVSIDTEIEKLNKSLEVTKKSTEEAKNSNEISEPIENTKEETSETPTSSSLSDLINSNDYASWNEAALSQEISSEQLITLAKKSTEIDNNRTWAETIANNISKNANSNDNVIAELINSNYYPVQNIAVKSEHAGTITLTKAAKSCASIKSNSGWAKTIATSIINSKNVNDTIINELVGSRYYDILNMVANSEHSGTITLTNLAKSCAKISNNSEWAKTIATSIVNNKNTTDEIISLLIDSNYYHVQCLVAKSDISSTATLKKLAKLCSEITNNRSWAETIANNISNNKNTDDTVMIELTNSCYYPIQNTVAKSNNSGSETLTKLAKKCAEINNNRSWAISISTSIVNNVNANEAIMNELANSSYYDVLNIVAKSKNSGSTTLTKLAKECAKISNNQSMAQSIANNICNNPNVTDNIKRELANSKYSNISKLAPSISESKTTE